MNSLASRITDKLATNPFVRPDPFLPAFDDVFTRMERMLQDVFPIDMNLPDRWVEKMAFPKVNCGEDEEGNIIVEYSVPGRTKEDLDISVNKNILTVSGETVNNNLNKWAFREITRGKFSRSVQVNEDTHDIQATEATMLDGILTIKIPKRPEPKSEQGKTKVEIK